MKNVLKAVLVAASLLLPASASSEDLPGKTSAVVLVPDQDIAGFKFSAMQLSASVPALACVVTGPANTTATVGIIVLLFESADASIPYAQVSGGAAVSPNTRALCDVNNGQQTIPMKSPKKIEIQISTTATIAKNQSIALH